MHNKGTFFFVTEMLIKIRNSDQKQFSKSLSHIEIYQREFMPKQKS